MVYITIINRERNEQIIEQAKELNQHLIEHNITPNCFEVFKKPNSLKYTSTKKIETYLARFNELLKNDQLRNKQNKKIDQKIFIKKRLDIIYKSFFNKPYRGWLLKRITDKNWQKEKLIQLGFKKQKRIL